MMNNPTIMQINALLSFLEEHRELARGHMRTVDGRSRSRDLWARLTDELNALGGCNKNVKQWQKVWADKKYLAKKSAAAARRSALATGGGPSTDETMSGQEHRIISLMGEGYGEPETDARVPAFPQNPPVQEQKTELLPPGPSPTASSASPDNSHGQHVYVIPAPRSVPRRRLRPVNDGSNMRKRLFAIEEQRVAMEAQRVQEMSLIRDAIQELGRELCRAVQASTQDILTEIRKFNKL